MRDPNRERERPPFDALRDLGYTGASRGRQWHPTPKVSPPPPSLVIAPVSLRPVEPTPTPAPAPIAAPAPAPAVLVVLPRLATSPEDLLALCVTKDYPDLYAAGKVLAHLGLSTRGASSLLRRVVPEDRKSSRSRALGFRLLCVDRVGVAYMVLHSASATAKALHSWAAATVKEPEEATELPKVAETPAPFLNRAGTPGLSDFIVCADLVEVAESRVLEAQAALADAMVDLSAARRNLRALLRGQTERTSHAQKEGHRAEDESPPIA